MFKNFRPSLAIDLKPCCMGCAYADYKMQDTEICVEYAGRNFITVIGVCCGHQDVCKNYLDSTDETIGKSTVDYILAKNEKENGPCPNEFKYLIDAYNKRRDKIDGEK